MKTLEQVREISLKNGFEFLDKEYFGSKFKHTFRCLIDNEIYKTKYNYIQGGHGLPCCGKRLRSIGIRLKIEDVKRRSLEKGFIFLDKEYKGSKFKHNFYCKICKKKNLGTFSGVSDGYGLSCCKSRKLSQYKGDKSSGWNPDLTEEDRLDRKRHSWDHVLWRRAIKKRDNYICKICGEDNVTIVSHHIESYARNKELRFDLKNGVCLCRECHNELHKIYGKITMKKDYLNFKKLKLNRRKNNG